MVTKIIPLDWQKESLKNWIDSEFKGMNIVSTGAGKSISAMMMMNCCRTNTLIIVKSEVLMNQWKENILKFCTSDESKIGFYYGKEKTIKPITIALIQTLVKERDKDWDKQFDFLIVDEARFMGAEKFYEFFESNKNFNRRIGLTATLERDDGEHKKILNYMGGYNYRLNEKESNDLNLINKFTYVSCGIKLDENESKIYNKIREELKELYKNVEGNPFEKISYSSPEFHKRKKYVKKFQEEKKFIQSNFNKVIVTKKIVEMNKGKKILIFNELNESSKSIYKYLKESNLNPLLFNSTNKKKHKENLEKFSNDDNYNILVATKCLDEGFDLPKIEIGILLNSSKSESQNKQRVGRIIRKSKNKSIIYDLFLMNTRDEENAKCRKHFINYADEYKTLSL